MSASETPVRGMVLASDAHIADLESLRWVRSLSAEGPERDDAVSRLHELLRRAAGAEVARRAGTHAGSGELDDLVVHAADDALVAILGKLQTYRGESRFTTWAYKFALLEAAVRLRKRPWQGRELQLDADGWARLADDGTTSPSDHAATSELISAVRDAIAEVLTPHQRSVLIALTLNEVPIDVLAERRGTTRGALYKTLHDARRKLRARLAQEGLEPDPGRGQPTRSAGRAHHG